MSDQPDPHLLDAPFRIPWNDLGVRLDRGISNLKSLAIDRPGDLRLTAKTGGLDGARSLYYLSDADARPGTFAATWRGFTDQVLRGYLDAVSHGRSARAAGFALALEYQRGYSADVDAPDLPSLLRTTR